MALVYQTEAITPQEALETVTAPISEQEASIEQIIRDAATKYGLDGNRLLAMANCESTLNPNSQNFNYSENGVDFPSGLFQHLTNYWDKRATKYGYKGASVFNATANANVTAGMIVDGQAKLWACKY